MGKNRILRIGFVALIFVATAVVIYNKPESTVSAKPRPLNKALNTMEHWAPGEHIPYDPEIVKSLKLDDYVNKVFVKDDAMISLYVGYYTTAKKIGAAHDPLVCFPGQGWQISNKQKGSVNIPPPIDQEIDYSTMRVDREGSSTLILYWFQAGTTAHASTFRQKLATIANRLRGKKEDNAFVRLTCTLRGTSESECLQTMIDFTKSFYPTFLQYIQR